MPKTEEPKGKYLVRQEKLLSQLSGNVRSLKDAAIAAGYSESYADTGKMVKSNSWHQLAEKHLPDKLLIRKHKQLLNKKEVIVIGRGADREAFPTGQIDANAVAKGLDMAYKIRDKYPKPQVPENFDEEMRAFVLIIRKRLPK